MASSTIMWLDEANKTAEFEPVGTHPDYRRRGLGRAMLLHGMQLARAAGATQMTVACLGAPGHPQARGLYYSVGFREFTRDAPLIKTAGGGPLVPPQRRHPPERGRWCHVLPAWFEHAGCWGPACWWSETAVYTGGCPWPRPRQGSP
jgi:hypothetical protein